MGTHEAIPNYGLPSRAIRLLLWGLILVQVGINARWVIPPMDAASGGAADFSIFYTGARVLHFGWRHELYNLSVQARFHSAYYRDRPLLYNHPAYELLAFLPLAGLKFSAQYYVWLAINLVILIWMALALSKACDHPLLKQWWFILGAALAFPPIAVCLLQGQDTLLLILIYSLTYAALKQRRDFLAGLILSLGLFKFHLILPFMIPMLLRRYWKFIQGFTCGALMLVAISIMITGFSGFLEYAALLRLLTQRPDIGYITPVLMPNLRGLLTLLAPGKSAGGLAVVLLSAITVGIATWKMVLPSVRDHRFDVAFAVNITSVILVSYHLYLHDLSLVFLPILLGVNTLNESKAKALFWVTVAVLFCMPVYDFGLAHTVLGFVAICVILLSAALMLIFSKTADHFQSEHAA
jgi:hypothetical protein